MMNRRLRRRFAEYAHSRGRQFQEWQEWLVDDSASQESQLAESEQSDNCHKALGQALTVLNDRERRIFEARQLVRNRPRLMNLPASSAYRASVSGN